MIVMPDANIDATINSLVYVAFRSEGERCFALNTVIFVGESKPWYSTIFYFFLCLGFPPYFSWSLFAC